MRARIIKIGNSQGIRLPKLILEQTGIKNEVELEVGENQIVIRAVSHPRSGWDNAFKTWSILSDDTAINETGPVSHSWDDEQWQW